MRDSTFSFSTRTQFSTRLSLVEPRPEAIVQWREAIRLRPRECGAADNSRTAEFPSTRVPSPLRRIRPDPSPFEPPAINAHLFRGPGTHVSVERPTLPCFVRRHRPFSTLFRDMANSMPSPLFKPAVEGNGNAADARWISSRILRSAQESVAEKTSNECVASDLRQNSNIFPLAVEGTIEGCNCYAGNYASNTIFKSSAPRP